MDILYELNCEECGAEYEILFNEDQAQDTPNFCPFCGSEVDMSDVDEEMEDDEWDLDDADFDLDDKK